MTVKPILPAGPFRADPGRCIACGRCAEDCVAAIITVGGGGSPFVAPEDMENCIGCQHCLAVCPTAAVEVAGRSPDGSQPVTPPDPESLDRLIRSRRSVRKFAAEQVPPELFRRVMETVSHAPTGRNIRLRRFTAVLDPALMAEFRERSCRLLAVSEDRLPPELAWLSSAALKWLEKGRDVIFRNAPHLIAVTAGPEAATPEADCLIALSYFDLTAQANGIGTVWCGMADYMLRHLPETRAWLNIPPDHTMGYVMLFGMPAVSYPRTAQYLPEEMSVLDRLG